MPWRNLCKLRETSTYMQYLSVKYFNFIFKGKQSDLTENISTKIFLASILYSSRITDSYPSLPCLIATIALCCTSWPLETWLLLLMLLLF